MQIIVLLIYQQNMVCRQYNFEVDISDDYPEGELRKLYTKFRQTLIERCMKFIQRQYSGFHFEVKCNDKHRNIISSVHSYFD